MFGFIEMFGEFKIGDVWFVLFVEKDVVWFEIMMDDFFVMSVCYCFGDFYKYLNCSFKGEFSFV